MVSLLIFGFKGVILESVWVKTKTFKMFFSISPEHLDKILQFRQDNGGMCRCSNFRYIYKKKQKEDLSNDQFEFFSSRSSILVKDAVAQAPFVECARDFIEKISKSYRLYIGSATPQEELKWIVDQKDISRYFIEILGFPIKKIDHILIMVSENNLSQNDVIFIGDAVNDWDAARKSGITFNSRTKPGQPNIFENLLFVEETNSNFYDLIRYMESKKC